MNWRLIEDGAGSGRWNMGVDEALLSSAEIGVASIRFYTWSSACLSVGYSQRIDSKLRAACDENRIESVRRVTGGRAILHGRDLTYCVAAPLRLFPGSPAESYAKIGGVLLNALRALGLPVEAAPPDLPPPGAAVFDCFANPAGHEIVLDGAKLVGSAQRRTQRALLQHGSIRCDMDPDLARRATGLEGHGATSLAQWGKQDERDLRAALREAFADGFGCELVLGSLTDDERARAAQRGVEPGRSGAPA